MDVPLDKRGYTAQEKNRKLDPEQVAWARQEYFNNRATARQLAQVFGIGTESVRRMLRGETYGNVGQALPRAENAQRAMDVDRQARESAERFAAMLGAADAAGAEGEPDMGELFGRAPTNEGGGEDSHEAAINAFLAPREGGKKGE